MNFFVFKKIIYALLKFHKIDVFYYFDHLFLQPSHFGLMKCVFDWEGGGQKIILGRHLQKKLTFCCIFFYQTSERSLQFMTLSSSSRPIPRSFITVFQIGNNSLCICMRQDVTRNTVTDMSVGSWRQQL